MSHAQSILSQTGRVVVAPLSRVVALWRPLKGRLTDAPGKVARGFSPAVEQGFRLADWRCALC